MLLVGNIIVILMMLLVGNIGRFNPVDYPLLANLGLGFPILLVFNFVFLVVWCFLRLRIIWLPLLGFLLCYGPIRTYSPFNIPEDKPHGAIKSYCRITSLCSLHGASQMLRRIRLLIISLRGKADYWSVCKRHKRHLDDKDHIYSTLKKHYPYFQVDD